jgi:preprotein translocase subunit YajC
MMPTFAQLPLWTLVAADGGANSMWGLSSMMPLVIIFVLFYFMLIRPERRRKADLNRMLDGLKKSDHVVTVGGIVGTVVNVQKGSDEVTIRVDESTNAKLRVLRSSIARVVGEGDGETSKESAQ